MGISIRHGPHQLAQKVTITAFLSRKSAIDTFRPSRAASVTCGAGLCRNSTVLPVRARLASSSLARQVMKIVKAASAINAAIAPAGGFVNGAVATEVGLTGDYTSKVWPAAGLCATVEGEAGVAMTIFPTYASILHGRQTSLPDRKSTRLNSSHLGISYAVFCLKKNTTKLT